MGALFGKADVIFSDKLSHASIVDGIRLSGAKHFRFTHNDTEHLEKLLCRERKNHKEALVITETVFSMDGDIAPLPELVEVAQRYDAMVMIDDAHGEGVLGNAGRGIADHFGLHGVVDIEVGTMSKAFGVVGGYVAGK